MMKKELFLQPEVEVIKFDAEAQVLMTPSNTGGGATELPEMGF